MSESENPFEKLMGMALAAVQIHEMYKSFVSAGFTEAQALELVKTILASANNKEENN